MFPAQITHKALLDLQMALEDNDIKTKLEILSRDAVLTGIHHVVAFTSYLVTKHAHVEWVLALCIDK